jgi:hypothetical protein
VAEEQWRRSSGMFNRADTTPGNLAYLELNYLRGFLTRPDLPGGAGADRGRVRGRAGRGAGEQGPDPAERPHRRRLRRHRLHRRGPRGRALPAVVFDADGAFLGVDRTPK